MREEADPPERGTDSLYFLCEKFKVLELAPY